MKEKYVVVDLETTGHTPLNPDKIIEVGMVVIENETITREFSTFLNPNMPIPKFITNLTGIHDTDVQDAPIFSDKAADITNFFADSYLVAHNVPFDSGFLNEELAAAGFPVLHNPVLDTVEIARFLLPQAPGFKLRQLADYLQISHDKPHRAITDARMTAQLLLTLFKRIKSLPYETINHLLQLEKALYSDIYALLKQQRQKLAYTNDVRQDIDVVEGLAVNTTTHITSGKPSINMVFGAYLDNIYETGGTMEQHMSHYEKRTSQRHMSETVYDAFQAKKHALIEAETGTGKSLAYLLPAIYEAVTTKKKVVISTYTTQLQSQLLNEEMPLIRKLVPFSFRVALLKGKQNYISLTKFARFLASDQMDNYDVTLTKAMILVWLTETETGDVDEIQLPSNGYVFFRQISADTEDPHPASSPWFLRSFYQQAHQRAQQADIVITNHALLCTDIRHNYQLLPSYNKAIIDEAHQLEATASKHYGLRLHYVYVQHTLSQIGEIIKANQLEKSLENVANIGFSKAVWDDILSKAKYETDDLFRMLFQYVIDRKKTDKSFSDIGRVRYRFREDKENKDKWAAIKEMASRLTSYLRELIHMLRQLDKAAAMDVADDLPGDIASLQSIIDRVEQLFLMPDNDMVTWMEIEAYGAKNAVYLYSEPTDVSMLLSDNFFKQKASVILTSATLSVRGSFSYSQNRLGLLSEDLLTAKIESPFPYERQVQLMVPNDFPDIRYDKQDDFIQATCEAIISLAHITDGRMLVLFTSYDMLRKAYTLLSETLDTNTYMLIAQGISGGSRSKLKKNFQSFDQAILLGTSSFWEGVDIPGEDLSCLMIVRLPFQPPNHPVYEAKSNALQKEGKNAFVELSLPNAVLRFKQGFGRLIRSAKDRGIVFVCDARIVKARYGKFFTESIPPVPQTYRSTKAIIKKAADWF